MPPKEIETILNSFLTQARDLIKERFDHIDERLKDIDEKMGLINIGVIEEKATTIRKDFDGFQTRYDNEKKEMEKKIDDVTKRLYIISGGILAAGSIIGTIIKLLEK